ncbi:MAG TPA: hypothetical protein VMW12_13880 [Candidatus Dormibacteraeota bacterium]|nr:hypothetical protein [Candidatus Dormibacteraeota bacterium]
MKLRLIQVPIACVLAAVLSGCGGGGGSGPSIPASPLATATPNTIPVAQFPLAIPFSAGGLTGSMLVPSAGSAPSGATLSLSATTSAPSGVPPLVNAGEMFVGALMSATVTLSGAPGFQFSLNGLPTPTALRSSSNAQSAPSGSFYLALADPTKSPASWQVIEGPGTLGNGIVVFAGTQTPMTFAANQTYVFELFYLSAGSGAVTVSPSALSFLGTSPSAAQLVTVSEAGYTGAFALNSTCSSVATITPSGNQYIVQPVGAGTCSATFSDANGHNAILPIVVTVTTGGGQ